MGSSKRCRLALLASIFCLLAALGTWISGQYRIGRLDVLINRYDAPILDYAETASRAKPDSMEADLLQSCKQSQIGSWLQTTDALKFKDPVTGNRILVELESGKDFIDINGRELASCIQDEVENQQFDIGSLTNTWAFTLLVLGLLFGGLFWYWRRPRSFRKTAV